MDVTVLGAGAIGSGMARSLLRAGHAVTGWNRTTERARPLADVGARVADDLADAVTRAAHAASLPTVLVDAVDRVYADLAATGRGHDDMATLSGLLGTPTAAPA